MVATDSGNIREVILFPQLRPETGMEPSENRGTTDTEEPSGPDASPAS
jgi:hypothetical protein